MSKTTTLFFELLKSGLLVSPADSDLFSDEVNWSEIYSIAEKQGVVGLCFNGIETLPKQCLPDMVLLMDWLGQVSFMESVYCQHEEAIVNIASFYGKQGIKMLLFKGYGLSLNYPNPQRRPTGDIDVYLYHLGAFADQMVESRLGIIPMQNDDKHSVFEINGTMVENHARFISDNRYPSLNKLEAFLEEDAKNAIPLRIGKATVYTPSIMSNALFLPYHTAEHFIYGESSLRQLCDWACFLNKYTSEIDWDKVRQITNEAGYYRFLCCLNGIVKEYLFPSLQIPVWKRDKKMEARILNDIINNHRDRNQSLLGKFIAFLKNTWKHRLVHNESIFTTFLRRLPAYILVHYQKDRKTVWK